MYIIIEKLKNLKLDNEKIALIGALLLLSGGFFFSYNYVQAKKLVAYEYMDQVFQKAEKQEEVENFEEDEKKEEQVEIPKSEEKEEQQAINENPVPVYQYIGYLEIPKISFKQGIVDKNSKDNNVEKNLYIAENSTYPDVENGNLIIAGHSGTGYKAFFKNLYKLGIGDVAKVEYQGKVYTYQIVKIDEQNKTGRIKIQRDYHKTTLTLVTCTKDKDDKQTIYILELVHVE